MRLSELFEFYSSQLVEGNGIKPSFMTRILSHLQNPLYRNGYALVLSSISTSAFGMVYWVLAARLYPAAVVGLNSAAISAMMFLAGIAQLNLNNALIRFIRNAGQRTRRFALFSYLVSILLAAVASIILVLFVSRITPALSFLRATPFLAVWFVIATVIWCIFVLQDGLLTGLRFATWVPVENTVYALVKIVLLVILALEAPTIGIFLAWTVAVVASILPTNFFIFKFLIPRLVKTGQENPGQPLVAGHVAKFVAADYFGSLSWMAVTYLLPIIVATMISPEANAYYYLSWTIAASLYLIAPNIGSSFIVETTRRLNDLSKHLHQVFIQITRLLLPITAIVIVGAPLILRVFGRNYSTEGTLLLRLLALSALPNIINSLFASVARVQQRRTALLVTSIASSALVLSLSFVFIPLMGIVGVGLAFLIGQSVLAVVILATQFRSFWPKRTEHTPAGPDGLEPVARSRSGYQLAAALGKFISPFRWSDYFKDFRRNFRVLHQLATILKTIPPQAALPAPVTWTRLTPVPTVTDRHVYFLGPQGHDPTVVLKLPSSHQALRGSQREIEILNALHCDPRLADWNYLIPKIISRGKINEQYYLVERVLPGVTAWRLLLRDVEWPTIQVAAANTMADFHKRTASPILVSHRHIQKWVVRPADTIQRLLAVYDNRSSTYRRLDHVIQRLSDAFTGCRIPLSWVHGDYTPGNILMTPDGSSVTGIVDWELAERESVPWLDLYMLLLTTRTTVQSLEFGDAIRGFLKGDHWTPLEENSLAWARETLTGEVIDPEDIVLLCWLQHVANNMIKSTRFRLQRMWIHRNILTVLGLF